MKSVEYDHPISRLGGPDMKTWIASILIGLAMSAGMAAAQDPGPPGSSGQPSFEEPGAPIDRVVLSFAKDGVQSVTAASPGDVVTLYLLARPNDPAESIVGFSCRVTADPAVLRGLTWQPPAAVGHDDAVSATFTPPLSPAGGPVVLATATAEIVAVGKDAVRIVNAPTLAMASGSSRVLPFTDTQGQTLDLVAPDLGPPGAPGAPAWIE